MRPTESNSREREEINDTAKDLRELGGRIKSLSYRGMMQLCELMQNASGEGKALPDVFLETADTLSKVSR